MHQQSEFVSRSLGKGHVIEETILKVIGEEFQGSPVDPYHAVMVATADGVVETGPGGPRSLQGTTPTPSDGVDNPSLGHRAPSLDRPGSLVAVDVPSENQIDFMAVVEI